AQAELARLRATGASSAMIETLAARALLGLGDGTGALAVLKAGLGSFPHRRPILYAYAAVLNELGRHEEALSLLAEQLRLYPRDSRLHEARAKAYAGLGKRLLQHQAQAEVYALQGSLPAAIEQLQLAQGAGDGNFYELSVVEARLRELRAEHARETQEARRR
ncbi:MAG: tetratricopeptide repeat protein, partial [Burkholderiales bacterium]